MTHPLQRAINHRLVTFSLFVVFLLFSSLLAGAWQPPLRTVPRTDLTDVAVAGYAGDEPVIFYNPLYIQRMGYVAETFFFAHEYAHHYLGHLKGLAEALKGDPGEIARKRMEYEREADCYAATLLTEEAPREVEAAISFFEAAQGEGRLDQFHPTGYQRASLIRNCSLKALSTQKPLETELPPDDPEASRAVSLAPVDVLRKSPQRLPVIPFAYRCENTGNRPVRCSLLVGAGGEKDSARRFDLDLSPGDVRTVTGRLAPAGPVLAERISCVFTGPDSGGPQRVSASEYLSFAGLRSGDGASEVVERFGVVMPRHGRFMSFLDYFRGSVSIGCNRTTKRVVTVDVVGLEGVKALKSLGINDPGLDLIGKSRDYVLKALGDPSPDPKATEFSRDADGVSVIFSCYGNECNQITVRWRQ